MLLLLVAPAFGWMSECFIGAEDPKKAGHPQTCDDGFEKARYRWVWPEGFYAGTRVPEHALIWERAAALIGLPEELNGEFELQQFGDGTDVAEVPESGLVWSSWDPVTSDPQEQVIRTVSLAELTQLPDMSYTLWDWARGNEVCPMDPSDPEVLSCHEFEEHMGAMNSSHFPPQARYFYAWYHQLALDQAARCVVLADAVGGQVSRPEIEGHVLACEQSALALEAVAQHYLQDAWSMGHMWERWGSAQRADWGGDDQALARGVLVGMLAGSWHGVKAVADEKLPGVWDDPMCAPAPSGQVSEYLDPDGVSLQEGVGDLFHTELLSEDYDDQQRAMFGCATASMVEVYQATPQRHGPLDEARMAALGDHVDADRDPADDGCWEQRVTNQTLLLGSHVHRGTAPNQSKNPTRVVDFLLTLKATFSGARASRATRKQFRRDTARARTYLAFTASVRPDGTDAAQGFTEWDAERGKVPARFRSTDNISILGAEPNSFYVQDLAVGDPPTDWVDPPPPWTLGGGDEQRALNLAWADATAWERCPELSQAELLSYRLLNYEETDDDALTSARVALCQQMVGPHLRIGTEADFDATRQPLCHFQGASAFVYSGHGVPEAVDQDDALHAFCTGQAFQDGGFEIPEVQSPWMLDGNAQITAGVNTLKPYAGAQMLDLYLDLNTGSGYGRAAQALLLDTLEGDWTLRFQWRIWTEGRWIDCERSDPWVSVLLDPGQVGSGSATLIHDLDQQDWCNDMVEHAGGDWKSPWYAAEVPFSADVQDPVLSFLLGSGSGSWEHHLLIDDVTLEKN